MLISADTHVHLYPEYPIETTLQGASRRLTAGAHLIQKDLGAAGTITLLFLTDRKGFPDGRDLLRRADGKLRAGELVDLGPVMGYRGKFISPLYVIPGKQIVTAEKIELLALATETSFPDGEPLAVSYEKIVANGAIPVLPWSPGKWFFARGGIVGNFIRSANPEQIFLGDIFMRPGLWSAPRHFSEGNSRGIRLLRGSDSLAVPGEEVLIGGYGTAVEGEFDMRDPLHSARRYFSAPKFHHFGAHSSILHFVTRMNRARALKGSSVSAEPSVQP